MDDLSEKIGQLLSSPEGMAQIKAVASMLGVGGDGASDPQPPAQSSGDNGEMLSALLSSLGSSGAPQEKQASTQQPFDQNLLLKITPILQKLNNSQSDPRVRFLESLRPFLGEEHHQSLDMAVTFLKLSGLSEVFSLFGR